jgi:hypothetical protein
MIINIMNEFKEFVANINDHENNLKKDKGYDRDSQEQQELLREYGEKFVNDGYLIYPKSTVSCFVHEYAMWPYNDASLTCADMYFKIKKTSDIGLGYLNAYNRCQGVADYLNKTSENPNIEFHCEAKGKYNQGDDRRICFLNLKKKS